jgi:hypothetical protein
VDPSPVPDEEEHPATNVTHSVDSMTADSESTDRDMASNDTPSLHDQKTGLGVLSTPGVQTPSSGPFRQGLVTDPADLDL